jgi:fructoselysine-6-P-deglycase FrlB-like protein
MQVGNIVAETKKRLEAGGGLADIYFVACGGSLAAFWPCEHLLQTECTSGLRASSWASAEFVHSTPKRLGRNSLVITCSHQGDTPETVAAAALAKSRGAACIALTYTPGSPITAHGDAVIRYEWGPGSRVENQKISIGLKLGIELLKAYEDWAGYEGAMAGFEAIHDIAQAARAAVNGKAKELARQWRDEAAVYTLASGASYAASYIESYCILMEMQWLHTASFHAGEFFHGALEITTPDTPFILLMSVGRTRPLDERALAFLRRYGGKLLVIDPQELGIGKLDPAAAEFLCPPLLLNTVDVFNQELARERRHPLTTRRYMWKVPY